MFKKFGIGMLAAVLAVAFSAFTAPNEEKTTLARTADLYWYEVVGNQIPQNASPVEVGPKSEAEALEICDPGANRDCLRGFNAQPDLSQGPSNAAGDDQIKTDEPAGK
jgi:hypothetical protein